MSSVTWLSELAFLISYCKLVTPSLDRGLFKLSNKAGWGL